MKKKSITITCFCMILAGLLLLLFVLGMKQLQVIGSMKNENSTENVFEETELFSKETELLSKETELLSKETETKEISAEEYYELESKNDDSTENEIWEVPSKENDPLPYYIKVNRLANCVTIYGKDEQGEYTIPVKAMVCSVGLRGNTPLGVFKTSTKYNWRYLYGNVYGQYAYRIKGPILFHSVPYYEKDKSTLETEEYNKLGEPASKGCVRLSVEDAKWLIDNCPEGTTVEIYDSEDPGPLGKPEAVKIDTSSPNKGWDPTDPDEENPWKTAEAEEETYQQTENWTKEYVKEAVQTQEVVQTAGADQTPPVIQVAQENLTTEIAKGGASEEQLLELAKTSAISMVSTNVSVEEASFYTNVLQVDSVEKEYQEVVGKSGEKQLVKVRVKIKISVEDAYQNRSEKFITVLVEIRDSYG